MQDATPVQVVQPAMREAMIRALMAQGMSWDDAAATVDSGGHGGTVPPVNSPQSGGHGGTVPPSSTDDPGE